MRGHKGNLFGLFSAEFFEDPYPTYMGLREHIPVCKIPYPGSQNMWLITRYQDCKFILFNQEYTTKDIYYQCPYDKLQSLQTALCVLGNNLFTKDDADHRRLRDTVKKNFLPNMIEKYKPVIQQIVNNLFDEILMRPSFDLISDYSIALITQVLAYLFGVTIDDAKRLIKLIATILRKSASYGVLKPELAQQLQESHEFIEIAQQIIAQKIKEPSNDLISDLLVSYNNTLLSEQELIAKLPIMIEAAYASTTHFIPNAIYTLLQHPKQWDLLKQDHSLINSTVEECLRYVSPINATGPRWVRKEFILHDIQIAKGDIVILTLTSANNDDTVFENPNKFTITRNPNPHIAFGNGPHVCLGQHLARLETKLTLEAILEKCPQIKIDVTIDKIKWGHDFAIRGINKLPLVRQ